MKNLSSTMRSSNLPFYLVSVVFLFGTRLIAPAQTVTTVAATAPSAAPADVIGPEDLLEISVAYCPDLSRNFRIDSNGYLTLPLLRKPLQVSGETLSGVGAQIRAALLDQHILAEPVVSIALAESRSHPVSVVGAVVHPITFQATSRTTLIDALARAEGLSPTAGGVIIVTSPEHTKTGDKTVEREIKVAELYAGNQPNLNITLTGGEEIRIPEAKKIFVAGDVRRPGMYPMQSDEATTVVKAIALSSGLDAYSSKVAYIYRESSPGAQRTEIAVPLKAIMKHHAPDVAMLPDDILYVPTNDGMRLAGRVLNQMAGFGQTAESGLLIAH